MFFLNKYNSSESKNWFGAIYLKPLVAAFLGMVSSTIIVQFLMKGHDELPASTMLLVSLLPLHVIAAGIFVYKLSPAILQLGADLVLQWRTSEAHPWKKLIVLFLGAVFSTIAINLLTGLVCMLFEKKMEVQEIVGKIQDSQDLVFILLSGVAVVVLAPVTEELLFRLGMYNVLLTRMPPLAATAVTSLFFAAAHGQASMIPGLFVIGLFLQHAKNRCGLRQSMLLHACYNAFEFSMILLLG